MSFRRTLVRGKSRVEEDEGCSYIYIDGEEDADEYFFVQKSIEIGDELEPSQEVRYVILSEADIYQHQKGAINEICEVFSISRDEAWIILHYYKWDVARVTDEWFQNEGKIRQNVGLSYKRGRPPKVKNLNCGICLEKTPLELMSAAACGHYFCNKCWAEYIKAKVGCGPECLSLRCPEIHCTAAVSQDMIKRLASLEDFMKYTHFCLRSYVEENRNLKWCPFPDCVFAVEFIAVDGSYDVLCKCSNRFCWKCSGDAHRPVDCDTVAKWISKNKAEYQNAMWILSNTKPCPKCNRPIEKNQGCMHMTCSPPCKFQFCWLCLGPWSEHGDQTGGFYACNRYEAGKKEGLYTEDEKSKEMAKTSLQRYLHYYDRWQSHKMSREKAFSDLNGMPKKIEILSVNLGKPVTDLRFITEAWEQIVECRQLLQWTYAYGYFIPEDESLKKTFFEHIQGTCEFTLECLHKCAEKDLRVFFEKNPNLEEFANYRGKLVGLTSVTRDHFEKMVKQMESGLQDVGSCKVVLPHMWSCPRCTYLNPTTVGLCQMCEVD